MIDYDAGDSDIHVLQDMLAEYGITKDMLNLDKYAGATFRELYSMVNFAIQKKGERKNVD